MKINKYYAGISVVLFIFGIILVTFLRYSGFIRGFTGDIIVVMFIVSLIKTFKEVPVIITSMGVFIFAVCVEATQYLGFIKIIGLEKSYAAQLIFGGVFDWMDILAYAAGTGIIIIIDKKMLRREVRGDGN